MILTVTLNPSLDRTVEVDGLLRGEVLRTRGGRLDPGGKGVNVTRALLANGVPSTAVLPIAGPEGNQLLDLLAAEGVGAQTVTVAGHTRSNITIAERDGTVTKLNEPGPELTEDELELVIERALAWSRPGGCVVLCGSLPPAVGADHYARMTVRLADAGLRVVVDTSGPALALAVAAGPELVKPNREELATAVGRPLGSRADVVHAAQELRAAGARRVLVSLGAAGALLVDEHGVTVGESIVTEPRSTVGAGDAFLAGFLAAEHRTEQDGRQDDGRPGGARPTTHRRAAEGALAQALAWGAAAVRLPGSRMPGPDDIDPGAVRLLPEDDLAGRLDGPLIGQGSG